MPIQTLKSFPVLHAAIPLCQNLTRAAAGVRPPVLEQSDFQETSGVPTKLRSASFWLVKLTKWMQGVIGCKRRAAFMSDHLLGSRHRQTFRNHVSQARTDMERQLQPHLGRGLSMLFSRYSTRDPRNIVREQKPDVNNRILVCFNGTLMPTDAPSNPNQRFASLINVPVVNRTFLVIDACCLGEIPDRLGQEQDPTSKGWFVSAYGLMHVDVQLKKVFTHPLVQFRQTDGRQLGGCFGLDKRPVLRGVEWGADGNGDTQVALPRLDHRMTRNVLDEPNFAKFHVIDDLKSHTIDPAATSVPLVSRAQTPGPSEPPRGHAKLWD